MPGETVTTRRRFSRTGTSSGPAGQGGSSQNNQGTGSSANQNNQGNQGNNNSQNNNQTGQSDSNQGEHKLLNQFKDLVAQGKGNTSQAQVLANYLHGVETKAQSEGKSIWNQGAPDPIDYSTMDFPKYDIDAPMGKGFGSWFGQHSLSTGSSQSIQDTYKMMADKLVSEQGYHPSVASQIVMDKIAPMLPMYDGPFGQQTGQITWDRDLMDIPKGHTGLESLYLNKQMPYMGGVPHYNYGGGWGSGWGSGGGGGSGGGYGFSMQQDPMQQGYQRGKVGPGSLQEQVNQIYLGMGNLNAAPGFNKNRGGIISLLGLN